MAESTAAFSAASGAGAVGAAALVLGPAFVFVAVSAAGATLAFGAAFVFVVVVVAGAAAALTFGEVFVVAFVFVAVVAGAAGAAAAASAAALAAAALALGEAFGAAFALVVADVVVVSATAGGAAVTAALATSIGANEPMKRVAAETVPNTAALASANMSSFWLDRFITCWAERCWDGAGTKALAPPKTATRARDESFMVLSKTLVWATVLLVDS